MRFVVVLRGLARMVQRHVLRSAFLSPRREKGSARSQHDPSLLCAEVLVPGRWEVGRRGAGGELPRPLELVRAGDRRAQSGRLPVANP